MLTIKQITFASVLILAILPTVAAQEGNSTPAQSSSLTITAAAAGERVRITAPASVVQMRIEVYAATGQRVFDNEVRGGNVLDWHLQDGQAQRLVPGSYVCVVTAKSISGRITQRIGAVGIEEKSVNVQAATSQQLSPAQAQTIGPVEDNSSWTIPGKDEPQTPTVIAHDGTDGQMIRGRGALTFRIGNFFTGNDTEQMRLTEDGRLGLGTSDPRTTLDVAGTIRAQRVLIAKPIKTSAGISAVDTLEADPSDFQPLIAGTGTQNRIAKWIDNAGTLGDSAITETAGNVGIGTTTPTQTLDVANGRIVTTGSQTLAAAGGILEIGTTVTNNHNASSGIRMRNLFNGNAQLQQALDVAPTFAPSANITLARGFISAAFFAPPAGVTIRDGYGGNAVNVYSPTGGAVTNGTAFAINAPIVFGALKPTTQYGLRINNQGIAGSPRSYGLFVDAQSGSTNSYSAIFAGGNVGIGTTSPQYRLHVDGGIGFAAVFGNSPSGTGLFGQSASTTGGAGVIGYSSSAGIGVHGRSDNAGGTGVFAYSVDGNGVDGQSSSGMGVAGHSSYGKALYGQSYFGYAGYFDGHVTVNGNVGIGTAAPAQKLHLFGSDSRLRIQSTLGSSYTEMQYHTDARFWNTGVGGSSVTSDVKNKYFIYDGTAGQFRLAIDTNGNVGIGTTQPSTKLHVDGGNSADGVFGLGLAGDGVVGKSYSGTGVKGISYSGHAGYFLGNMKVTGNLYVDGAINPSSDRNIKANFSIVNPRSVLDKLASIPIQFWNYKAEGKGVRHIGPVAQDFRKAFGLGKDDLHISTVDADGVAMASIQALYQLIMEKDRQNQELDRRVEQLQAQLAQQQAQLNQVRRAVRGTRLRAR